MPYKCLKSHESGEAQKKEHKEILLLAHKVAETDLREDKSTRKQCLQQFKEWIQQNQDIENCITDDDFLLRFLRAKKFSLPMAQQTLLKYLNFRKIFRYICYNMDYLDPKVHELITKGFIFVSPYRDPLGRRVIIVRPQQIDPYKCTSSDITRAVIITIETLMNDEENQILGVTYFGDARGISPAHIAMWNITEFATLVKWGEQSFPVRHKLIHCVNMLSTMKYVLDFALSRLSEKLRNRVVLYNNETELREALGSIILPEEYGGKMPMAEMIELWVTELAARRKRLLSFDKMNLLSDKGIIGRRSKIVTDDIMGLQGSFRRLEVD